MTEAVAIQFIQLIATAVPPIAALLDRYLPAWGEDSLADRIRAVLPADSASSAARQQLEREGR